MIKKISPSKGLNGTAEIPGDKSISHRALMISAIGEGRSEITGLSKAADPESTRNCLNKLGVRIEQQGEKVVIVGKGLKGLTAPSGILDAGNSGTTMRLLSGILAGQSFASEITGDDSLRHRPMKRLMDPLRQMGADISGSSGDTAPLRIKPVKQLRAVQYQMQQPSAQVKSALLFAGLFSDGVTTVTEPVPTRDHTERMLGLISHFDRKIVRVEVRGGMKIEPRQFSVPGDISAAAFFISAALLVPNSELRIRNVGLNPTRTAVLEVFLQMGGTIIVENKRDVAGEPIGDLIIRSSDLHTGFELNGSRVAELIDEIPILAVTAAFAPGVFSVRDAKELRVKETDRITAIVTNLRSLGVQVEEYDDGFSFEGGNSVPGKRLQGFGDHRIAMAFAIAGLRAEGEMEIEGAECADISFPEFWDTLDRLQ